MDPSSQFIVPTIIDVPELIVTNDDIDYDETNSTSNSRLLNKLRALAPALSYTLNIGNVLRFPYLCYKYGGGIFLTTYTATLILVGLPLFLMEQAFGQYSNEGPITIWRISPAFEGVGYSMCLISTIVAMYYNVINTWIIHYLLASITVGDLPWSRCDNVWNSAKCFLKPDVPSLGTTIRCNNSSWPQSDTSTSQEKDDSLHRDEISTTQFSQVPSTAPSSNTNSSLVPPNCSYEFERVINSSSEVVLATNEYFHRNLLSMSSSLTNLGSLNWSLMIGLALVWSILFIALLKDVRVTYRYPVAALSVPFLVLIAFMMGSLTLPGSSNGINFYFNFDWSKLQNIDIWADATAQIFFSISPSWGGIITLASANKFHNNFHSDTLLIVCINYISSIVISLLAFAIVGHMSFYSGIRIDQVVDSGLGFVFMVYTEALAKIPFPAINSLFFFSTLLFIGFTSQITVMETVVTTIVDTWPHKLRYRKPLILMTLCTLMFALSLITCFGNGFYIVQIIDLIASTYVPLSIALLELIAIAWVYGMENFIQDINDMISIHRSIFPSRSYWCFMWRYLTPSFLFAVLLFCFTDLQPQTYQDYTHPAWTVELEWLISALCLLPVPLLALLRFILTPQGSLLDKITYLCKPSEDWAPSSYVSGPKLINRHLLDDSESEQTRVHYSSHRAPTDEHDHDQDSNDSNEEDLKVINGRANYIIAEEEDDTDTGLVPFVTNETNV